MATSDTTKDAKAAKADQARIRDLPEPEDSRELTPGEEMKVWGGGTTVDDIDIIVKKKPSQSGGSS